MRDKDSAVPIARRSSPTSSYSVTGVAARLRSLSVPSINVHASHSPVAHGWTRFGGDTADNELREPGGSKSFDAAFDAAWDSTITCSHDGADENGQSTPVNIRGGSESFDAAFDAAWGGSSSDGRADGSTVGHKRAAVENQLGIEV